MSNGHGRLHDSVVEDERAHVSCPNPRATLHAFRFCDRPFPRLLGAVNAPSTMTPRPCGRVSLLGGNQSRHLVLELLGDTSTPALGHRLRERLGEDVVFSVLYTVEDRLRYRLR